MIIADGRFLALRGRYVGDAGAYAIYPWTPLVDPLCAAVMLPGLYDVRAARFEVDAAYTNKCPTGAYRGVGWTSGQTAREALVDDVARELGVDPMELRLRNTIVGWLLRREKPRPARQLHSTRTQSENHSQCLISGGAR